MMGAPGRNHAWCEQAKETEKPGGRLPTHNNNNNNNNNNSSSNNNHYTPVPIRSQHTAPR